MRQYLAPVGLYEDITDEKVIEVRKWKCHRVPTRPNLKWAVGLVANRRTIRLVVISTKQFAIR